jgi:hypothetical protein
VRLDDGHEPRDDARDPLLSGAPCEEQSRHSEIEPRLDLAENERAGERIERQSECCERRDPQAFVEG